MHSHERLKIHCAALRDQLDRTVAQADADDREENARSEAFHGLTADCREIARGLLDALKFGELTSESYQKVIACAAERLTTMQAAWFNEYIENRYRDEAPAK